MADILDEASELSDMYLQKALAEHFKKQDGHDSFEFCIDCEDEIPEARRKLKGVKRCIYCQDDYEKVNKHYNK